MGKSKNNGTNFLVQGSILAVASIISRIIGLVYRIPLNNILIKKINLKLIGTLLTQILVLYITKKARMIFISISNNKIIKKIHN